jgi:hypothetical protein
MKYTPTLQKKDLGLGPSNHAVALFLTIFRAFGLPPT